MPKPQIEIIPLWSGVAGDRPTCLDVLAKITPPALETNLERPPLNLALVLDRSGSMQGAKLKFAKEAACFLVEQLGQVDRVSVTVFDDQIATLVPNLPVLNNAAIQEWIRKIKSGGSTALYDGWKDGAEQVLSNLQQGINRVLLLSDGQANVGESNPDSISGKVHRMLKKGVSTTTLGVGNDYNEDLMEAMARSGDGNYYFIETADQLPSIFDAELHGLTATCGQRVSFSISPSQSITVLDVFNDFDRLPTGRFKLPNLMYGHSLLVAIRLQVPAIGEASADLCEFRLAWDDTETGDRQKETYTLTLPTLPCHQIDEMIPNPQVQEQVAILLASRAKKEAIAALDRGDDAAVSQFLKSSVCYLQQCACSPSADMEEEFENLKLLEKEFLSGERSLMRKKALDQSYRRSRNRKKP